jgi:sulfatase modifying factor 1
VPHRNKCQSWSRQGAAVAFCLLASLALATAAHTQPGETSAAAVLIPGGSYIPAFARQSGKPGTPAPIRKVQVDAFWMDRFPVTNEQFLRFLIAHPEWRKSKVKALFADVHYLERWRADLSWDQRQSAGQPVTSVSWFAAKAYCEAKGEELPTTDQWEYALWDQGRHQYEVKAKQLAWFAVPTTQNLAVAASAPANEFGVHGLVGLVWEWTLDFESAPTGSDVRNGTSEKGLYCGGASVGAKDPSDYGAFMRYSFRSCLKASFTTRDLGFRCVMRTR